MPLFSAVLTHPMLWTSGTAFILIFACGVGVVFSKNKNIRITSAVKITEQNGTYLTEFDCGKTLQTAEHQVWELQSKPFGVLIHDRKQVRFFFAARTEEEAARRLAHEQTRFRKLRLLSVVYASALPPSGNGLTLLLLFLKPGSALHAISITILLLFPAVCYIAHDRLLTATGIPREYTEIFLSHLILFYGLMCNRTVAMYLLDMQNDLIFGVYSFLFLLLPAIFSMRKALQKI